jgi:sec-independent protein translocase protein TatA
MLDGIFAPDKLILIAIVGLVLFGPKRLPQIGRSVGRWLGEFRSAAGGLHDELKAGMTESTPAVATPAVATPAVATPATEPVKVVETPVEPVIPPAIPPAVSD